jgi:hypothetical protein
MTDKLLEQAIDYIENVPDDRDSVGHIDRYALVTALKERLAQDKALQALHDENERLGLYKDAYGQPESECNPQDLCAGCRCKYAHVQPEQEHPVYSPFISCELWRLRK